MWHFYLTKYYFGNLLATFPCILAHNMCNAQRIAQVKEPLTDTKHNNEKAGLKSPKIIQAGWFIMMPNAEQSLIVCWRQLPAALRWRDTATFQNVSFWVWFYAYSSIFIIAHANQGGSSWQAVLICQHLWVATETRRPNYLCSIWQRLQKRPPPPAPLPLHNPLLPLHRIKRSTSNVWFDVDCLLIEQVAIMYNMYELITRVQ